MASSELPSEKGAALRPPFITSSPGEGDPVLKITITIASKHNLP